MKYLMLTAFLAVAVCCHSVVPASADPVSCNNLSGRICGWFVISPKVGPVGTNGVPLGNDANDCFQLGSTIDHTKPHCATLTHVCNLVSAQPDPGKGAYYIFVDDFGLGYPSNYVENAVCNTSGYSLDRYFYIIGNGGGHFAGVPGVQKPVIEITGSNLHWGKFDVEKNAAATDAVYIHGADDAHHTSQVRYFYNTTLSQNSGIAVHAKYTDAFEIKQDTIANNGYGPPVTGSVLIENSPGWVVYQNAIYRSGAYTGIPVNPGYGVRAVNSPGGCYQENHTKNEKNGSGQYGVVPNLDLVNSPGAYLLGNYAPFAYTSDAASQNGLVVSTVTDQGPCAVQFQ